MMRRLLPTIAALMGGFLPQLAQFNWTLPSLSTPSVGRLSSRSKGSNAAVKREATKRRNIAKRLSLRKRR